MKRIPATLLVALGVGLTQDVMNLVAGITVKTELWQARWQLASIGLVVVEYVLLAVGFGELARRATGSAHRLLGAAAVLMAAVAVWYGGRPLFDLAFNSPTFHAMFRWGHVVAGALATAAAVALVLAARGFSRLPLAAALVIIAMLGRGWFPVIGEQFQGWLWRSELRGYTYWLAIGVMWAWGAYMLAAAIASEAPDHAPAPHTAAAGFRRLASALRVRIVVTVMTAALSVAAIGSIPVSLLVLIGGPLIIVVAIVVAAFACLRVAGASVDGMPPVRLVIGGALLLWWSAVQLQQSVSLYNVLVGHDLYASHARRAASEAWMLGGPLLATLGLALVGSAISAFAHARANDALRESASVRTLIYVVLSASSVGILMKLAEVGTRNPHLVLVLVGVGAGIGALVAIAGLAARAATAIEDTGAAIPPARVVSDPA